VEKLQRRMKEEEDRLLGFVGSPNRRSECFVQFWGEL